MSLALFSILLQNLYTNYLSWNVLSIRSSSFTSQEGHGGMVLKKMYGERRS